jgi:hypothetical protein
MRHAMATHVTMRICVAFLLSSASAVADLVGDAEEYNAVRDRRQDDNDSSGSGSTLSDLDDSGSGSDSGCGSGSDSGCDEDTTIATVTSTAVVSTTTPLTATVAAASGSQDDDDTGAIVGGVFAALIVLLLVGAVFYRHQKRAAAAAALLPPKEKDDGIKIIIGMTPTKWGDDYDENKDWRGEEGVLETKETSFGATPASEDGESHTSELSELSEPPEPAIDPFFEAGVGRPQGVALPVLSNGRFVLAKRDAAPSDDASVAPMNEDVNPREWLKTHSTRPRSEHEVNAVDVSVKLNPTIDSAHAFFCDARLSAPHLSVLPHTSRFFPCCN